MRWKASLDAAISPNTRWRCKAVQLAENRAREKQGDRAAHVGYYLVDRGRPVLERLAEMRLSWAVVLDKLRRQFPLTCYLSAIALIDVLATSVLLLWSAQQGVSWLVLSLLAVPALIGASSLGIGIVNWLATQVLSPQSLPRLDFEQGIPPTHRTLVAVPTMLTSAAGIEHLLEGLEVRYLANRDPCLHFALLTDFLDAAAETLPGDAELGGTGA